MEITGNTLHLLLKSFPIHDLSYEINKNEPLPSPLDLETCLSIYIPMGPKYFAWFSTGPSGAKHGVYLLEWNRQKRVPTCHFHKITTESGADISLFYDTIIYGTWTNSQQFVMEDLYFYKGENVTGCFEKEKWRLIWTLLSTIFPKFAPLPISFVVPHLQNAPPLFHHVQVRQLQRKTAYVNYLAKGGTTAVHAFVVSEKPHFKSYDKPQYRETTIFKMCLEPFGNDLYKLFAYGPRKSYVFYDYAMVHNIETSVYLKNLFHQGKQEPRHVKKRNWDYLEESDDEEDEDRQVPEYVLVRCQFHTKFKKWIPLEKVNPTCHVVHIRLL